MILHMDKIHKNNFFCNRGLIDIVYTFTFEIENILREFEAIIYISAASI